MNILCPPPRPPFPICSHSHTPSFGFLAGFPQTRRVGSTSHSAVVATVALPSLRKVKGTLSGGLPRGTLFERAAHTQVGGRQPGLRALHSGRGLRRSSKQRPLGAPQAQQPALGPAGRRSHRTRWLG